MPTRAAFDENLTYHKAEIPQLFWFNALLIASNGTDIHKFQAPELLCDRPDVIVLTIIFESYAERDAGVSAMAA